MLQFVSGLLVFLWLISVLVLAASFVPRVRDKIIARGWTAKRARLILGGCCIALLVAGAATAPPDTTQTAHSGTAKAPHTSTSFVSAKRPKIGGRILASIENDGSWFNSQPAISSNTIKSFDFFKHAHRDFDISSGELNITIDTGQFWSGNSADILDKIANPMAALYRVALEFPQINTIYAVFLTPAAAQHDRFGNKLPGDSLVWLKLKIPAQTLRQYSKKFDWSWYAIYAANPFVTYIRPDPDVVKGWESGVKLETAAGGFPTD